MSNSTSTATCNNTVFSKRMFGAPFLQTVQGPPQKFDDYSSVCRAFNGKSSCCSKDTLDNIKDFFDTAEDLLEDAQDALEDVDLGDQIKDMLEDSEMDEMCDDLKQFLPTANCDDLSDVMSEYADKYGDAFEDVIDAALQCTAGFSAYYKGMLCFACEPEWSDYVNRDTDGNVVSLKLHTDTCTNIVQECKPVNDALHEIADVTDNFMQDMMDALLGSSISSLLGRAFDIGSITDEWPDMCGGTMASPGDCTVAICESEVLSGINVPSGMWNLEGLKVDNLLGGIFGGGNDNDDDDDDDDDRDGRDGDDDDDSDGNGSSWDWDDRRFLLGKLGADAGPAMAQKLMLQLSGNGIGSAIGRRKLSSANTYSEDGYDAYSVGTGDIDNGPPATTIALISVFVTLGFIGIIVGIVFGVKKSQQKAKATTGTPHPTTHTTGAAPAASSSSPEVRYAVAVPQLDYEEPKKVVM